ncbi:SAM and SH3 domain-containing protein 3-like [Anguilla anguilla]|uniref:SAM and SH3 domain-containing protein 3-like n=1 Tax=Anguilla anguilla TaxID=7936 RepID=UPI0015B374C9|nr:SAM and SH3 domain-containing protein 3-like [Anguilla anguilla]
MLRRKSSNASEKEPAQVPKRKLTLQRSSSFKDFMKSKPASPVVADKEFHVDETLPEDIPVEDAGKSSGKLGKKWRAVISRTMSRKTSRMVQKTLSEEGGESEEEDSTPRVSKDWTKDTCPRQRTSLCSNESEDTAHPPLSRQFSGCGDRQSLDSGYSQRDSMRLEDSTYTGPFCGRARVHTDFTPSPYDIESLKLQKGDIIDIIEKPPVGTWTGKLNNKVGSFKFIYVTILPNEVTPPQKKKTHRKNHRSRPKPKTMQEVLEKIGLTDLGSLLSMQGFDNLEDFSELKGHHLNELNITDPEQRAKILSVVELLNDSEGESDVEEKKEMETEKEEEEEKEKEKEEECSAKTDAPRDSGCFESSETLENGREETVPERGPGQELSTSPDAELNSVEGQLEALTVAEEES